MEYLKLAHGAFNFLVMLLFIRQGLLGLKIHKSRKAGAPLVTAIKQHRQAGPIAALLAAGGFTAGATLAIIDHGHLLHYPLHFSTGATLTFTIGVTYLVSKKIRGPAIPWRTTHICLGITILTLYPLQVILGLGIFL